MRGMEVRSVQLSDFEAFGERFGEFDLEKNAGAPNPARILMEEFESGARNQLVALRDGEIVGFISVSEHEPGEMYIRHLFVSDDARGKGVSGRLVDGVLDSTGAKELHIWTETSRFPDFSDLLGFRVVESETVARYLQRIGNLDLSHHLPRGWVVRSLEEVDIEGVARFLVDEGMGSELTDYQGDPSSQDGSSKGQAYLSMVCEEFSDYFLVCLSEDGIIGLVFGGLSLHLARGQYVAGEARGRGWVQWLVVSRRLGPDQRRDCFSALLVKLVQRMGEKGAVWFEALVDPMDKDLSEAMNLTGLEIQDQHRFVHLVGTHR